MTARPLRIGLVGTGFGTRVHVPAFARCPGVELVSICSARLDRAKEAAERFDVPSFTDDFRELIDRDDVDLVDVCTPPDSHLEISLAALDAGRHVLCEKPLALDAGQAEQMAVAARAAEERGLVHAVNHEMRYLPVRRYIRQLVAEGFLGRPQFVTTAIHVDHGTNPSMEPYYWGWLAESGKGGGALMSLFSHHLDLLRFCFGEIHDPSGRIATLIPERPVLGFEYRDGDPIGPDTPTFGTRPVDTDDTAAFTATIGDGAVLTVSGSWSLHHPSGVRLEVYGDGGTLQLLPDGRLVGSRAGDGEPRELTPTFELPAAGDDHYLVPALAALITDVQGAVEGVGDRLFATFEDGWRLQQTIDAVRGH